jgi:POT family proton-dependent oligopeptide transporter
MLDGSDRGSCRKSSSAAKNKDLKPASYGACDTKGYDAELVRDAEQALRVVPIMAMLPVFWMLYDQQESVWILQASRMSLHGLQPEQLSLVNPIQIMVFIPLFDRYLYPALTRWGWKLDPLARMGFGMLLAAAAFVVSGALEIAIQRAEVKGTAPPTVLWQLIQITIMAVSEILVSVTGLEFSYSAAPSRLKAFLMAVYSLTKAVGDLFGGVLYSTIFQEWNRATVMCVCAILMLLNRVAFDSVATEWYKSAPTASGNKEGSKSGPAKTVAQPSENSSLLPH